MPGPRFFSADEVRAALPMRDAIQAMRDAFGALAAGRTAMPVRSAVPVPGQGDAILLVMSGRTDNPPALGTKLVTVFPRNETTGVPVVQALVVLVDPATGTPQTLLDGTALTAIRTGAASGLATDLLARTDAHRVAMLGAGVQARTQLEAMCCVRPIESVTIWSRSHARAESFAAEIRAGVSPPREIRVAATSSGAVNGADIVCCATTANDPVLADADVTAGMHINGVGSFTPAMREVDPAVCGRALVVVDQRDAAMAEAGEVMSAVERGIIRRDQLIELGAIVDGAARGRSSHEQITFFKSVGLAVQDLAAGAVVERGARRQA